MVASESVIVPMQCEYYALEGLSSLTRTLGLVRDAFNPNLEIEGIVRIELGQEVTLPRPGLRYLEQAVVQAYLRRGRMGRRDPVHRESLR